MTWRLTILLCGSLMACGGETGPGGLGVETIDVNPDVIVMAQQDSVQLQVAALDEDGRLLTAVPFAFESGDPDIVLVSATGLVRSAGPAGATEIIVRAGGKAIEIPTTITATGQSVRILPATGSVPQLGSLQLDVALLDVTGAPVPGAQFVLISSDPSVATVTQSGLVTSVGPKGEVTLTVTSGSHSASVAVVVTQVPTSLRVLPDPIVIGRNASMKVTTTVLDVMGEPIPGTAATFAAAPGGVIAIDQAGTLSAMGIPGSGTVTVTLGTLTATVPVTVIDASTLSGSLVRTVTASGSPYGIAIGAGGSVYSIGLNGNLFIGSLDAATMSTHFVTQFLSTGLAVNPATGRVYVASHGVDALLEIDEATGEVLRRWGGPEQMFDVAVSSDGESIFVGGSSNEVYVISAASMAAIDLFPTSAAIVHLLVHPTQPLVYASGAGKVHEINLQTRVQRVFTIDAAQASALTLDNDRLFVGSESGLVAVIDLTTGSVTSVPVPCAVYDLVVAPSGTQLLATCGPDIKVLDAASLATTGEILTGGQTRRAAISPGGERAVVANQEGWITHLE